jgi:hypothetical protein
MKTKLKLKFLIGMILAFLLISSSFSEKSEIQIIDLADAIEKKIIKANFLSNGNYQGESIAATLTNISNIRFKLKIPAGSYFNAQTAEEQSLTTLEDFFVQLLPNATTSKVFDGFCTNASNSCPIKGHTFSYDKAKKVKKIDELTQFLKGKKIENNALQDAVWTLTNNHSLSHISSMNNDEAYNLRVFLAKLTGKKNEWYDKPQTRTVDQFGNINLNSVKVEGKIDVHVPSSGYIHQEVQDASGKIMMNGTKPAYVSMGKLSYQFKVEVKGWQKGKYFVKLMNGTKVLLSNEFEV